MRGLVVLLSWMLALPLAPGAMGQAPVEKLNLVIVEGDGAINNIRQRTAREPIVQVQDENHRPVAGAAVTFVLPDQGAGATFANGSHTLTVMTDNAGRAAARGMLCDSASAYMRSFVAASGWARMSATHWRCMIGTGSSSPASAVSNHAFNKPGLLRNAV
mgnify:CR=1 FL=1